MDSPSPSLEQRDVALAVAGDARAFERLYRDNAGRVFSLARRMAGEDLAEDLTQEVFVRAWEKLGTFRGASRFGTWLHRLAVNLILSRRATVGRRRERETELDPDRPVVSPRLARPGLRMDLEWAIDTLPDGARQVFVMYDVEGFTHQEIANSMEISVGTSKSQLHRARMMLRERLG